jgi:site-specific recombinase XerD
MSTLLRKQFIDHMTFSGLAENTKRSYVNSVKKLAQHYNCSPDILTREQVELFFQHLVMEEKMCLSACHHYLTGIKYFYKHMGILKINFLTIRTIFDGSMPQTRC